MTKITVAIPVGPEARHAAYLDECLQSVADQTEPSDEVLLIDDMHGLDRHWVSAWATSFKMLTVQHAHAPFRVWRSPWHLGVAHAFNFGVALARNEQVFMLGADDRLKPDCLAQCARAFETNKRRGAYYYVAVEYPDGEVQVPPCNAAMVTKSFWAKIGGFPVETAVGMPDGTLLSIMHSHEEFRADLIPVHRRHALYWYRQHAESFTEERRGDWSEVMAMTRNILTETWQAPRWGRSR